MHARWLKCLVGITSALVIQVAAADNLGAPTAAPVVGRERTVYCNLFDRLAYSLRTPTGCYLPRGSCEEELNHQWNNFSGSEQRYYMCPRNETVRDGAPPDSRSYPGCRKCPGRTDQDDIARADAHAKAAIFAPTRQPTPSPLTPVRCLQQCPAPISVYFAENAYRVTGVQMSELDAYGAVLQDAQHCGRIAVVGYADRAGAERYNLKLGWDRAKAVAEFLQANTAMHDDRLAITASAGEYDAERDRVGRLFDVSAEARYRRVDVHFLGADRMAKCE